MNSIFKTNNITIITDDYNSLKIVVMMLAGFSVLFALMGLFFNTIGEIRILFIEEEFL